jgi:uncharacterized membrane protein YhaH (DUF805 family)
MFKNPFSFDGRIRRTEFGISFIIYLTGYIIVKIILESNEDAALICLAYIPLIWFMWAQGTKRCHDIGKSGWRQFIPFYVLWLLFEDGQLGSNQYGDNPKGVLSQSGQFLNSSEEGYQGGYGGGHNNSSSTYSSTENPSKKDGYKDGDLYK